MLVSFFHDDEFIRDYQVSFGYRFSKHYEKGFENRVNSHIQTIPLKLLDTTGLYLYMNTLSFKPLRIMMRAIINILLIKYIFLAWNTVVLFRVFKRDNVDILHINNGGYPGAYSCMAAVFAARLRGIRRIVYVVNNVALPYRTPGRWLDYLPDRFVVRCVSSFVTGSTYARQVLKKVLNLSDSRVIAIHNGIACRKITESKEAVLARLGIDKGRILVSTVAVIEKRKGHIYLLEALKLIKQKQLNGHLPLVLVEGCGGELPKLMEYVRAEGLDHDVKFIGHEENVFNLLNAVDVIVLPSVSGEDFPNIILEGMSLGKCIVASRISGTPEQIEHEKSGILVEPRDVDGLAKALIRVVNDEQLRDRLGERASSRFAENFQAKVSVKKYRKLYTDLLGRAA